MRGRQRSTHLSGIAENINLFVVTIGKVCKQQAGGLALQRWLGCQAGRQASSAIMQNAKSVCTANVDKGEPRKKVGGDTQRRTPISCLASKKALTLEIIGNSHEIITILVLDLILYFSTLEHF